MRCMITDVSNAIVSQTCQEKVQILDENNVFRLLEEDAMCFRETRGNQEWYVCSGEVDFSSARERWWFIVLSKCNSSSNLKTKEMYLHYNIHMTNGEDLLHKEYSADEFYIVVADIVFLGLYLMLMLASLICACILKSRQQLHATYKIYLVSLVTWTVSLACLVAAWLYYGITGWKMQLLETIGRILQMCSNVLLILLLILVAKGYTVVRYSLPRSAVVKITVFMVLYITAMVVMFVWENILFDPGLVLYYYESPPGYGMLTVILIGWLWFTKSAVFTLKHYSYKTSFYVLFYVIYTIWFWASPIVVLIAMFVMAKWTREKTVNGVQQAIEFTGHLFFLFLTLPHRVNHNFPYNAKTMQTKPGSGRNKKSSYNGDSDISSKREPFPTKGCNLDIIAKSKCLPADEANLDLMLNPPAESSSLSDGKASPITSQKTKTYMLYLSHDNDSIDTDSTTIGESKLLPTDTLVELSAINPNSTDEGSSRL
ncbi:hypothetical protein BsWGS_28959 [Bradybaena similaris]